MCDIADGFKLCTCKGEEKLELGESCWILEKRKTSIVPKCDVVGSVMFPEYSKQETDMIALVLQNLNQRNCFDFRYRPRESDVLTIILQEDAYRFRFLDTQWRFDESTPFDAWREQMVFKKKGIIKNKKAS